ncbi:MAG TPA: hypothetical protein DHU75_01075 [Rikenellaceae bacterium]|nr:hypothetical protein [Rikenellaceae bacterium]
MKCNYLKTMRTRTLISALMGIASLTACNKNLSKIEYDLPVGEVCELTVRASSELSVKATGGSDVIGANEKLIKNLQVFVFRGDFLDAYQRAATSSLSLTCTAGERVVYAIVNGPDLSSISSKNALESYMVDLSVNAVNALVMTGYNTVTLPQSEAVDISVDRLVSRVVVKKISRDFESNSLGALKLTIKKLYLSDAAGNVSVDTKSSPSKWYNTAGKSNELTTLLSDSLSEEIPNKSSYSTQHYFYTMPNDAKAKSTKLIIEVQLGEQVFYYPIVLPALEGNHSYEISEIVIKRPGADTPDTPVTSEDVSFSISINDWSVVPISEQII